MEVTYDFQVDSPPEPVREYLMDPRNLMKYVPAFKDLREAKDGWELQVKWLFTLRMQVVRQVTRDEVTYLIKKTEGLIKVNSYLRFVILPTREGTTVKLTFFYDGPFQGIAKRQTESFYKRGVEIFVSDLRGREQNSGKSDAHLGLYGGRLLHMRTLFAKKVRKEEIESVLEEAMVKSVERQVVVILSDGNKLVQMNFRNGDLESQSGELESLGEEITVLMKAGDPAD